MKLSFNEATASECSTLEQDLILCEKNGFDYIEIRGDMLLDYLQDHTVEDLKTFFKHSHIKPHAINALYVYNDMFHPEKANVARDRALMAYFLTCCQVSKEIGNHYFIVVPHIIDDSDNIYLPHDSKKIPYPDSHEKILEDSVRILTKLSDVAKRYDINIAWEPVGSPGIAVKTVEQAMEIINAVNRDNVGITVDPMNLHLYNKLNDFSSISRIPKEKIFACHLNNCDAKDYDELDHSDRCFATSGEIDIGNYLTNVKATGYDGMVSIETFRPEYYAMKAEDVIAQAYKTTKEVVDKFCG